MFRAQVLIVRRAKLYYAVSGIITPIGGRPVHRFIISLFHSSTCFEHKCSSSGGQKLYYAVSGIITLKQVSGLKLLK